MQSPQSVWCATVVTRDAHLSQGSCQARPQNRTGRAEAAIVATRISTISTDQRSSAFTRRCVQPSCPTAEDHTRYELRQVLFGCQTKFTLRLFRGVMVSVAFAEI